MKQPPTYRELVERLTQVEETGKYVPEGEVSEGMYASGFVDIEVLVTVRVEGNYDSLEQGTEEAIAHVRRHLGTDSDYSQIQSEEGHKAVNWDIG